MLYTKYQEAVMVVAESYENSAPNIQHTETHPVCATLVLYSILILVNNKLYILFIECYNLSIHN
jgi:hypothetical protein